VYDIFKKILHSVYMEMIKFSCYVPADLYLEFTKKAREKSLNEKKRTRGAITNAVIKAMELWLNEGEL